MHQKSCAFEADCPGEHARAGLPHSLKGQIKRQDLKSTRKIAQGQFYLAICHTIVLKFSAFQGHDDFEGFGLFFLTEHVK